MQIVKNQSLPVRAPKVSAFAAQPGLCKAGEARGDVAGEGQVCSAAGAAATPGARQNQLLLKRWLWVKTNGTPGEHQNRWYMRVHPPQNRGMGYDPSAHSADSC